MSDDLRPRKRVVITTAQHHSAMQRLFPRFQYTWNRGTGIWRGSLQPQTDGAVYQVKIHYKIGDKPRVTVLHPAIDKKAPHLYSGGELCLYYPSDRTWHSGLLIAETIVPMAAEWLLFYELWKESGKWWGPEAPHPIKKQSE